MHLWSFPSFLWSYQSVPDQPGQHDDLQKIVSPFTEIEGDAAKLMAATKKKAHSASFT